MTLDAIKSEITSKLRELQNDSGAYSESTSYPDLNKLIVKAIGKIALCESAQELMELDELFAVIEDCYNLCVTEATGHDSNEEIFDFSFELDDEDGECPDDTDDEASEASEASEADIQYDEANDAEEPSPIPKPDIKRQIAEVEACFDKLEHKGNRKHDKILGRIYDRAVYMLEAAESKSELSDATEDYRDSFKALSEKIDRYNKLEAAKQIYDDIHPPKALGSGNKLRFAVGAIALLSGIGYGIAKAVIENSGNIFLWDGPIYCIAAAGLIYIILSAVYVLASKEKKPRLSEAWQKHALFWCLLHLRHRWRRQ